MSEGPSIDQLAKQVEQIQKFIDEMKPNMWFVTFARAVITIFAVAFFTAIGTFLYTWGSLNADVKNQAEKIADVKKQFADDVSRLDKSIEKLADLVERRTAPKYSMTVVEGTIEQITDGKIVLKGDEDKEGYLLNPKTRLTVDGKDAKAKDLKPGMRVKVGIGEGKTAFFVNALKKEKEFKPLPYEP